MSNDEGITAMQILDKRLGSIESKLDRLIRLEERQNTHSNDIKRVFVRVEKVEERVRQIELKASESGVRTASNAGAITIFISSAVSIIVGVIAWKIKGP